MLLSIPQPNTFNRLVMQIARTAPMAWLLSKAAPPIDRLVIRITGGRTTATSLMVGLPVVMLTTVGAKTGQPRQAPLLAGVDGERLILFATNFGGEKNPAWYYNLTANPNVTVTYKNQSAPYASRPATAAEKERYWPLADALYPGYANYRQRASHREIPVVVLTPTSI
jgi:deazaflavin-dependent oxidoreductase (nitroreductase family)